MRTILGQLKLYFSQVSVIRDNDTRLSLDGLAHEGAYVGVGQGLGQGGDVVERDALESDEK